MSDGIAGMGERLRDWADRLQRRRSIFGFPYAVIKKYGDDEGGRHAALLTYYGFLSIFPLLLLVVAVVQTVLQGNAELRQEIIDNIVPPDLQPTVENAVSRLPSSGVPLAIALVALLFSTMGIVFSAYQTLNHLAGVPHRRRHEFFPRYLRIIAMLIVLIVGVVGIGALGVIVAAIPDLPGDSRIAAGLGTALLVFLLLWTANGLLLPHRARLTVIWPAALVGSLAITALITFGASVLPRLIAKSGPVYGSFATIAALFALLYLVSQVLVYAGEIALVRRRRLWPRALDPMKPTTADRRSLTYLAREQERIVLQRNDVRFDGDPTNPAAR